MLILATVIVFALNGTKAYAGVWTTLIFAGVCVFLGLTFIPKVRMKKQTHTILLISMVACKGHFLQSYFHCRNPLPL